MTIKVGSETHKELFCRQFLDTHERYDPPTLPWPDLDATQLARLRSVPFWQEVYHTERRAGAIVAAFTPTVQDPLVRKAVALQGVEETRHAQLLRVMIDRYGLEATEQPLERLPSNVETAFIDFGFGECMDSFLGFGAFKTARQSEFLPDGMFKIFDVLMHEETRHIVFFINYMAWREVQRGRGVAPMRALTSAWYYGRALRRLLGMVGRGKEANDGRDFAVTEANLFLDGFQLQAVRRRLLSRECTPNEHVRPRSAAASAATGNRECGGGRTACLGAPTSVRSEAGMTTATSRQ